MQQNSSNHNTHNAVVENHYHEHSHAKRTSSLTTFFRKIRHKTILNKINFENGISILDTSCQDGTFLEILLQKNNTVYVSGVDMNPDDVLKAQKNIPNGVFKVTNNKKLPFEDGLFDVVITSLTLHHMDDPVSSLSEMKRVLKKDGSLYLVEVTNRNNFVHKILKYIKCPEPYHFEKWYSTKEVKELVEKIGLKIEKEDSVLIFPTISIVMPVMIWKLLKA